MDLGNLWLTRTSKPQFPETGSDRASCVEKGPLRKAAGLTLGRFLVL